MAREKRSGFGDTLVTELLKRGNEMTGTSNNSANHYLCLLERKDISTAEAISVIANKLKLRKKDYSLTRPRDQYAMVRQYLSLNKRALRRRQKGKDVLFEDPKIRLSITGEIQGALKADDILANRYYVVLRGLDQAGIKAVKENAASAEKFGLPNYFANIIREDKESYPAWHVFMGGFEKAVKILLTSPSRRDRFRQRSRKELIAKNWGKWKELSEQIQGGPGAGAVRCLAKNPDDFEAAFRSIPSSDNIPIFREFRQYLFNQALLSLVKQNTEKEEQILFNSPGISRLFYKSIETEALEMLDVRTLMSPGSIDLPETDEKLYQVVFEQYSLPYPLPPVSGIDKPITGSTRRDVLLFPEEIKIEDPANDDRKEGFFKLPVQFTLIEGGSERLVTQRLLAMSNEQ